MTQNIKNLKQSSYILIILLFIQACTSKKTSNSDKVYYYEYYSGSDSLNPWKYISKQVLWENDSSYSVTDYYYNNTGEFIEKEVSKFIRRDEDVYKSVKINGKNINMLYLTTTSNDCVEFKTEASFMNTEICLLTKSNINNKMYQFSKKKGETDYVETILFLDKDLILFEEEYKSGDRGYFKITRIDVLPDFITKISQ